MGLWRITKDGATIGHVETTEGWPNEAPFALDVAVLWGVIPPGSEHKHGAVLVPNDAIEDEARRRIQGVPDLAPHEDELIAYAKRQTLAAEVLDHLSWLAWGNAGGIRHWIVGTTTGTTV